MSYQVLARKWRPAKFSEMVGQEHVKSALINGLNNQRVHHAYLFSGTRGVGKTSIARIFAKSLNCEEGISSEPCGKCSTCLDVDAGRYVDLIEIDAASRTKVGDTREILDNVMYAPTRGRYKIYLIDEVHMLSRHSFNALLKTLEEPPEHVKFLLATTDPQKLPVTILSRCLQFNLQALSQIQISQQLQYILQAEQIPYELSAIELLAKFARGSMRDSLSLTDQAIAQSGQNITLHSVQAMMGTLDSSWSQRILVAILSGKTEQLVELFEQVEKQSPNVKQLVDDLLVLCHQIAMTQVMPTASKLSDADHAFVEQVAKQLSAEEVQVYYQLLLQGKKELPYASDPTSGFEMSCLRLLAFRPASNFEYVEVKKNEQIADKPVQVVSAPKQPSPTLAETSFANEKVTDDITTVDEPDESIKTASIKKTEAPLDQDLSSPVEKIKSPEPTIEPLIQPPIEQTTDQRTEPKAEQTVNEPSVVTQGQVPEQTLEPEAFTTNDSEAELLAQQVFYQEMAESQGFEPDFSQSFDAFEQTPNQTIAEPVIEGVTLNEVQPVSSSIQETTALPEQSTTSAEGSTESSPSLFDNPVMAILASRGISTPNQSGSRNQSSSVVETNFSTSEPVEESSSQEPNSQDSVQAVEPEPAVDQETVTDIQEQLLEIESEDVRFAYQVDTWASLIERSNLAGLGRQLALHSEVVMKEQQGIIELKVKQAFAHLLNDNSESELRKVVRQFAPDAEFIINKSEITAAAPADIQQNINVNRQERAEQSIQQDPLVQSLIQEFDAKVLSETIKPI